MNDWRFQNRRDFLRYALGAASVLAVPDLFSADLLMREKGFRKLTVLYTNDQHSRIDPFPSNDPKFPGEGGFSRRAELIEEIRRTGDEVLLLDAGDIFQGTPYFNFFKGALEYKLMSMMGYDAVTFGNHDFDLGCGNIAEQMPHAKFDFLNANYRFGDTALAATARISERKVYRKGGLKIGVTGVGIRLDELVDRKMIKGLLYEDPVKHAEEQASILKNEEKCDLVICLSHLGYSYESKKISDLGLAASSRNIDLIIGGHTHTFLNEPVEVKNLEGRPVMVTQVGWGGIWLGKINFYFSPCGKKCRKETKNHPVL